MLERLTNLDFFGKEKCLNFKRKWTVLRYWCLYVEWTLEKSYYGAVVENRRDLK